MKFSTEDFLKIKTYTVLDKKLNSDTISKKTE